MIQIGHRQIGYNRPCFVIAELGHNHQGRLSTASQLIQAAASCGAHAVKLQKRDVRQLYRRSLLDQPYDHENSFGATYGEHRLALEFGQYEYEMCQSYAETAGIERSVLVRPPSAASRIRPIAKLPSA